jgi:glycosyltransferase involved in cell wall biosynthesis
LKYWLLTTEYPPAHGGGISTYCRCTAEMLSAAGVSVTVIVADEGVGDYSLHSLQKNVLVIRFNPARRGVPAELGGAAGLSYAFWKMVELLMVEGGTPDIIESQDYLGIGYYLQQHQLLGYPRFRDVPIVITIHAPAFIYQRYNRVPAYRFPDFWTGEMEKHSIRSADMVISPSVFMAKEVEKFMDYGPRSPVILPYSYRRCEPGMPARSSQQDPSKRTPSFQRNKIVYYGKLSPQKGSFEMLRYFSALWAEGFRYPLHIIGGDDIVYQPEELTMGQLITKRYGEFIRKGLLILEGKIEPGCISDALADAHVVLLPSIVDNLPFACLETMACGKIVLASVQGGQREIITDGVDGFLFDHQHPASFGDKLRQILELTDDEINRVQENAKVSILRYDYGTIAPRKIALLEELQHSRRPACVFPFLRPQSTEDHDSGPQDRLPVQDLARLAPERSLIPDLLSVIIPFYNLGAWLDECIRSVLGGTWRRIEILVVNDGSGGLSNLAALDRWRDHPEVIVIDVPNGGLARARNTGARRAAGGYLAFLDADDAVLPDYYEKAIRVLEQYANVHFAGSWIGYFGDGAGIWPAFNPEPPYLLTHNSVNSSALVYKTKAFLAAGLNDPQLGDGLEDYESVVSMVHRGLNGVVLPEPLHRYRVRQGSMIRSMNRTKLLLAHNYIMEKHSELYQRYAVQVAALLNSNGPGIFFENPTLEVFTNSHVAKPGNWRHRLKRFIRRHPGLKRSLLIIRKKTHRIWRKH